MLVPWYAYCVGLRNVYDVYGDGEHPSKCNARRAYSVFVVLSQHVVHDVLLYFVLKTRVYSCNDKYYIMYAKLIQYAMYTVRPRLLIPYVHVNII